MVIPIKIPREQKEEMIRELQAYFLDEREEEIGNLAAEQIVDYMIKLLGPHLYNQAIADVRTMITQKMDQIDDELYALERPIRTERK